MLPLYCSRGQNMICGTVCTNRFSIYESHVATHVLLQESTFARSSSSDLSLL